MASRDDVLNLLISYGHINLGVPDKGGFIVKPRGVRSTLMQASKNKIWVSTLASLKAAFFSCYSLHIE